MLYLAKLKTKLSKSDQETSVKVTHQFNLVGGFNPSEKY